MNPRIHTAIEPTRVFLVRHAESADPTVFHGAESDVALSDLGERQAVVAAQWFRQFRPTSVVSSALRRAVDTARPVAEACGVNHRIEPRFHERIVGELCGVPFSATDGPWADTLREWTRGRTDYTTPGAESFDDLRARLRPAWDDLVRSSRGERIVLVSHGVVCKVLLLDLLENGNAERWNALGRVANLAVSELVDDGEGWRAERLLVVSECVRSLTEIPLVNRTKSEA
jgi:2,3-bisphosphoglycerate-dependent phosphoglycerate mutase